MNTDDKSIGYSIVLISNVFQPGAAHSILPLMEEHKTYNVDLKTIGRQGYLDPDAQ